MEFGMVLDVLDLPASLKQWDSFQPCNQGLLAVPSYEDLNNMKAGYSIFPLDNEDESSSGLSLGSSPSNASSTMNACLGLGFDFEMFDEATEHTGGSMDTASASPSIISLPAPTLCSVPCVSAPIGLPIGKLNLKLNASAVASAWISMSGNAPVFNMPRSQLIDAAANVPSLEARTNSLSVEAQEGRWISTFSRQSSRRSSRPSSFKLRTVNHAVPSKPQVRKTSSSSQKRKTGGKSSDKRPRIKGRFVRRDELEEFTTAANNNRTEDVMLVPEAAFDDEAAPGAVVDNVNNTMFPFADTMGLEAVRAY